MEDDAIREMRKVLQLCAAEHNPLTPDLERMVARYDKMLRRFNKTVAISDQYQLQLMDLKARLEVTARTDLLTGLANRWKIMEQLEAEQSRAERHGSTFSILIADLDHFKLINDTYGHLAGDRVLKAIADCFSGSLRGEDFCGRWGGEEFLIVLPETGLQQACQVAEKLIAGVRQTSVVWEQQRLGVTVSVGVGSFRQGMSLDACIKLADDAMYVAKREGRDRYFAAE
jgi:diguanylate cyclase